MKKLFLLFTLCLGIFISCQKNAPETTVKSAPTATPPGVIPSDLPLHGFTSNPNLHTWKQLDDYYKTEVTVKHRADSYYNNLKKTVIFSLVNQYNLLGTADYRTIDFYAGELLSIDMPDPNVLLKVFETVKGRWSDQQLGNLAMAKYEGTVAYINDNFADPQAVLAQQGEALEKVRIFAEGLLK